MTKDYRLLAEAYGNVNKTLEQSRQRLLSRIKPEFQKLYIADLKHFNGSYRDHMDILRKAEEMGHLAEQKKDTEGTD